MPAPDDHSRTSRLAGLTGGPLTLIRREATRVPFVAISAALQAWQRTAGVRGFALRRSNEALQIVAHTPLGRFLPQPVMDDDADAEAERIASDARAVRPTTSRRLATTAAKQAATPPAPAKPSPVKAAPPSPPAPEAVEAGAPGTVTDKVERISDKLGVEPPASSDDLPIPDFDNVSLGSLRARLRSLTVQDLVMLREWEQVHANRLPVITLLENRIAKVSAESPAGTAYPSGATTSDGNRQLS